MTEYALRDWILKNGGTVHGDINLIWDFGKSHRGVRAAKAISGNELLLRVPLKLCMHIPPTPSTHDESDVVSALRESGGRFSPFLLTTLLLMAEKAQGEVSLFHAHIASMPEKHDCTLGWSSEETAFLQGTELVESGTEDTESVWTNIREFITAREDLWPAELCQREDFVWAAGMVQSRSFHIQTNNWVTGASTEGTDLFLIPAIDMLNHSSIQERRSTELEMKNTTEPGVYRASTVENLTKLPAYFIMSAGRDIAEGEEILHTYGDLSDGELLRMYGFVEQGLGLPASFSENPNNFVSLSADDFISVARKHGSEASSDLKSRIEFLKSLGLCEDRPRIPMQQGRSLDAHILTIAQVLLLDRNEYDEYVEEATYGSPNIQQGLLDAQDSSPAVSRAVMEVVDIRNKRYPKGGEVAMAGGVTSERQHLAKLIAEGERKILLRLKQAAFLQFAKSLEEAGSGSESEDDDDDDGDVDDDDDGDDGESSEEEQPPKTRKHQ